MKIRETLFRAILSVLSFSLAQAATPPVAWERNITAFKSTSLSPDHLGRFALVGATSNRAGVFLLTADGEIAASAATCFPTDKPYLAPSAVTDQSGRIFLLWPGSCIAFEPGLTAMSRLGGWYSPYDGIRGAVPDEAGGVYAAFRYSLVGISYLEHFRCGAQRQHFSPQIKGDLSQAVIARSPSGTVHLIAPSGYYRCASTRVISFMADGQVLWDRTLGFPPSEIPSAAVCDSQGNLLIVGQYTTNCLFGGDNYTPVLVKLSPQGDVLWRAVAAGRGPHSALAVNDANEIIVTGAQGIFKYSPEGAELWRVTEPAHSLRLTRQGEAVLLYGGAMRKLSAGGDELWRTDVIATSESLSDYSVDDSGDVYVATTKWFYPPGPTPPVPVETIVRKYVAQSTSTEMKPAAEVPVLTSCEPLVPGPCDLLPPPPPPPPPADFNITRLSGSQFTICWPTNYAHYQLEAARHLNQRNPQRTKWITVIADITTNAQSCCVTVKVARYGKNFRIVP